MAFLNDQLREHGERCARARQAGDWPTAARYAALAAEAALNLAGQCQGQVALRYVEEAEAWLDAAEKMQLQPSAAAKPTATADSAENGVGGWAPMPDSGVRFADIAGMADAKQAIHNMIIAPLAAKEHARALGVRPGGGVLFFGPPGNGKTMIARAIAGEIAAPFYYATGAEIRSKWHGESEQRLRSLIQTARANPIAVLFLDEIEAIFPKRGRDSAVDNRIVTQFLAEVGGFVQSDNVLLLLGATNRPWDIDDAVFRTGRFDRKIYVGAPDVAARQAILARQLRDLPGATDIDLDAWAERLDGYTGSDLVGLVDAAKRNALRRCLDSGAPPNLSAADLEAVVPAITASATPELLRQYEQFLAARFAN